MDSKIQFRNTTIYTEEIAMEAGDAFWEVQPAYKKRANRFKIGAALLAATFAVIAGIAFVKQGFGLLVIISLAMMVTGGFWFVKSEGIIRNSAKKIREMGTKVIYGVSDIFFFVIDRRGIDSPKAPEKTEETEGEATETSEAEESDVETEEDEFEGEILSLEELLVCIVTENLYILIWPQPYYILDRHGFDEGQDEAFRTFIEEHARIIEA